MVSGGVQSVSYCTLLTPLVLLMIISLSLTTSPNLWLMVDCSYAETGQLSVMHLARFTLRSDPRYKHLGCHIESGEASETQLEANPPSIISIISVRGCWVLPCLSRSCNSVSGQPRSGASKKTLLHEYLRNTVRFTRTMAHNNARNWTFSLSVKRSDRSPGWHIIQTEEYTNVHWEKSS